MSLVSKPPIKAITNPKIAGTIWKENVEIADKANKPGEFTSFWSYEYTSRNKFRNLHRNVFFRDCAKMLDNAELKKFIVGRAYWVTNHVTGGPVKMRAEDRVQLFFPSEIGVTRPDLQELLLLNFARIRNRVPRVRQDIAPGPTHTILTTPAFYTLEVDGTSLRDWMAAHAEGKPVHDVVGEGCAAP